MALFVPKYTFTHPWSFYYNKEENEFILKWEKSKHLVFILYYFQQPF